MKWHGVIDFTPAAPGTATNTAGSLRNVIIHKGTTFPTGTSIPQAGQVFFYTGASTVSIPSNTMCQYDGSNWTAIATGIGSSGYSGVSGYSGRSGYSGYSGISGYSGTSGYSGISGYSASATRMLLWYIPGDAAIGTELSARITVPFAATITRARAYAKTAPTGANLIFDIAKNSTSIWNSTPANRVTIVATNNSGTQTSFDTTSISATDYLTVDVDQIGSTLPGSDITVSLELS